MCFWKFRYQPHQRTIEKTLNKRLVHYEKNLITIIGLECTKTVPFGKALDLKPKPSRQQIVLWSNEDATWRQCRPTMSFFLRLIAFRAASILGPTLNRIELRKVNVRPIFTSNVSYESHSRCLSIWYRDKC